MGRHGTIAGRKAAQDSKRGQIFTKYARAISVAAKAGGDPEYNIALKHAIDKAKAINMPNDNINRAIQKGTGELGGDSYEPGYFDGYGAGGVAVIVEVLTDNKNRTSSYIKHAFDKHGGNLGVPGCVSYMFDRKGVILIEKNDKIDEDSLMEAALDAGALDFLVDDEWFEVQTSPEDFDKVSDSLKGAGYNFAEADIEFVPSVESSVGENELKNLKKMIDMLEDNEDVQKVSHNCSNSLDD
jgi:YebC/PmpR family DNA-binding regulatory protein